MLTFSQSLQMELGPRGVYVQAVLPGVTCTEIWDLAGISRFDSGGDGGRRIGRRALVGFDRREAITIPPLPEVEQWDRFAEARKAMMQNFGHEHPAKRYRQ